MKLPQPIPYQGSKRNQANIILKFFPDDVETLIEPFAGSAAISIAASYYGKAKEFIINDINKPLMDLLNMIVDEPVEISNTYTRLWHEQIGNERQFYDEVRDRFNETQKPEYLLYLLARCVKASVRYNTNGQFNQSPDNRRKGRKPDSMRKEIYFVSQLLKDRVTITSKDYRDVLEWASPDDLVYMDPPYQGVCGKRDSRYLMSIDYKEFISQLSTLVNRGISFILSYDGKCGNNNYGKIIPNEIGVNRLEIEVGRSTQSTLLGGNDVTYESLYFSEPLISRLKFSPSEISTCTKQIENPQYSLF